MEPGVPLTVRLGRALARHWVAGAGVALLTLGATVASIVLTAPVYRAEARLRLDEPPPPTGVSAGALSLLGFRGDPFSNDLELLRSRTLAEEVVQATALQVRVIAARGWHRDSLFERLAAGRETRRATYEALWDDSGRITVRRTQPRDSTLGTVTPGEALAFDGVTAVFRPHRAGMPRRIRLRTVVFGEAVRVTGPRLAGTRTRREANVVALSYDHPDPGLAVAVVRETVGRFIAFRNALQRRETGQAVDSVRLVAAQTRTDLARAEDDLQAMQRLTGLVAPTAQNAKLVERYADLTGDLRKGEAELSSLDGALRLARANPDAGRRWVDLVSFPRFLENTTVGELAAQLVKLDQEARELLPRRTPENLELKTITEAIEALSASLVDLAGKYRDGLAAQVANLRAQLTEADSLLHRVPEAAIALGRRERQVRLLSEVYLATEQRLRQEELRSALTTATVQVVDPAQLRSKPVWPRKRLQLLVGGLLSVLLGLIAVGASDRLDPTLRTVGDILALARSPFAGIAVRTRDGGLTLPPDEARAILARTDSRPDNGSLALAAASRGAGASVRMIGDVLAQASGGRVQVLDAGAPLGYAEASAAARSGGGVLLVVEPGRTSRHELARAIDLLARAGAPLAGVVLACPSRRDADRLWG